MTIEYQNAEIEHGAGVARIVNAEPVVKAAAEFLERCSKTTTLNEDLKALVGEFTQWDLLSLDAVLPKLAHIVRARLQQIEINAEQAAAAFCPECGKENAFPFAPFCSSECVNASSWRGP